MFALVSQRKIKERKIIDFTKHNLNILIVDDDHDDIAALREDLEEIHIYSFNFDIAKTLEESNNKIKSTNYDCIFLDYTLPDGDGISYIKSLAKDLDTLLPIILLTVHHDEDLGMKAISYGAQDFLTKQEYDLKSLKRSLRFAIERNKLLQELSVAKQEAIQSNKAKSNFLNTISHEIRTPLNGIVGGIEILSEVCNLEGQEELVEIINSSSNTLLELIDNILDSSKIDLNKVELNNTIFSLKEMIDQLGLVFKPLSKVEIIIDPLPIELDSFVGDSIKIKRILSNLIGNSVKFTSKGHIRVKSTLCKINQSYSKLLIAVEDTGIGMDLSKFDKIFEKFCQEDSSITRRFGGSGLGLSISKNLAKLMGGDIYVESTLEKGTTFIVEIPTKNRV